MTRTARALRSVIVTLVAATSCALPTAQAWADTKPATAAKAPTAAETEAETRYAEGLTLLQSGKAAEALEAFDASARAFPSPNTELVRGHALRALDRKVDAMNAYESVVRDAGARVRGGDARFEATLADAGTWIAFLRPELGELSVVVRDQDGRATIEIDGAAARTVHDPVSSTSRARLWHAPGSATVTVESTLGGRRERSVEIVAGDGAVVDFDLTLRPPDYEPPAASWVAFGIGTAGFVTLAVAGGLAATGMSELEDCKPFCEPALASETETRATVANVGLAIGLAGALTGGTIWLVHAATQGGDASTDVAFSVTPFGGHAAVRARF